VILVVLVAFPVIVALSGAVGAAVLAGLLKADVAASHAGSELLDCNV